MRASKGLSPLIATVVLISVTVLGGLMIYTYFLQNVETMLSASQTLLVRASSLVIDSSTMLVYVEAVNSFDKPVEITEISYITLNGTKNTLLSNINATLAPGEKYSNTIVISDPSAVAVIVKYRVDGRILESEPASVRK